MFLQRAFCAYCHDRIWGLGRQGFKCTQCKLLVHKKCHKLGSKSCTKEQVEPILNERDGHNGVSNDHQAIENVPQAADYPPEIANHGKYIEKIDEKNYYERYNIHVLYGL